MTIDPLNNSDTRSARSTESQKKATSRQTHQRERASANLYQGGVTSKQNLASRAAYENSNATGIFHAASVSQRPNLLTTNLRRHLLVSSAPFRALATKFAANPIDHRIGRPPNWKPMSTFPRNAPRIYYGLPSSLSQSAELERDTRSISFRSTWTTRSRYTVKVLSTARSTNSRMRNWSGAGGVEHRSARRFPVLA